MSNESRNSIHYRGEYHTKRTHLSEKNTINECVEKILIVCVVAQKRKLVQAKINGTGLILPILIAIKTVILNYKSEQTLNKKQIKI